MKPEELRDEKGLDRALEVLARAKAQIAALKRARTEPIAIVGMGCRFPGSSNGPEAFWRTLKDGVDAVQQIPATRWPQELSPADSGTRWAGLIDQVDGFDPALFGVSPREAVGLDPQHRLLLEVTWEALEHANIPPDQLVGSRTGVFLGMNTQDYYLETVALPPHRMDVYSVTGNGPSFAAGRISYHLGLQGPCFSIDTACSSSLVAIHVATQSLRNGESDLVIAGGVNLILSPISLHLAAKTQALSPDGRCKTFDARANGFVRGEGCGLVVLKRLSDAQRDGNRILALIRGTAINQDGHSSGLTAPNVLAQQALLRQALENAGATPSQVSYVEAHGTGTSLGDPIEFEALREVLGEPRPDGAVCTLGSVKTNLGHLESAAGVAGLIKVVLAMQHGVIPRQLHFQTLNPRISLEGTPFVIASEEQPWPAGATARLAGVSSFGMSGTNSHVVLEEAPKPAEPVAPAHERSIHLLTLTANSPAALKALASSHERTLREPGAPALRDVCHTANLGRARLPHRLALVADSTAEAARRLEAFAAGQEVGGLISGEVAASGRPPKIAFLFTGQGSQYAGMGRRLYESEPVFRATLDRCAELLRPHLEQPLLSVMHGEAGKTPLDQTAYTQPLLFALEYALSELWSSWGIQPDWVMGHSVGELVAACVAGVFSLEEGLALVAERGRLMQALPEAGEMAALFAPVDRVAEALAPYAADVSIAGINGPEQVVISGRSSAVRAVMEAFTAKGVEARKLVVSHAFHSPLMDPMLEAFTRAAGRVKFEAPRIALASNVTGRRAEAAEMGRAEYWRRHVREPVRFSGCMETLRASGCDVFVEIGPGHTLLRLGQRCLPEGSAAWVPSLQKDGEDLERMYRTLGELYVRGAPVNWKGFHEREPGRWVSLPTYPFQRERYWIEGCYDRSSGTRRPSSSGHPLLSGGWRSSLQPGQRFWEVELDAEHVAWLKDHRLQEEALVPATLFAELALAAAYEVSGAEAAPALERVTLAQALFLPETGKSQLQLVLTEQGAGRMDFRISSAAKTGQEWTLHASGAIRVGADRSSSRPRFDPELIRKRCPTAVTAAQHYEQARARGMAYGPAFQCVEEVWRGDGEALGRIQLPAALVAESQAYRFHPALLDACLQVASAVG
ncbi:type I polyketide synthase, partial [Hyalangium sp.]|uniref:type I polyketide synthase n=1 Tax=Hyalangium sp. TaxID=2028555 RepID=UPI002D4AD35E